MSIIIIKYYKVSKSTLCQVIRNAGLQDAENLRKCNAQSANKWTCNHHSFVRKSALKPIGQFINYVMFQNKSRLPKKMLASSFLVLYDQEKFQKKDQFQKISSNQIIISHQFPKNNNKASSKNK